MMVPLVELCLLPANCFEASGFIPLGFLSEALCVSAFSVFSALKNEQKKPPSAIYAPAFSIRSLEAFRTRRRTDYSDRSHRQRD